MHLGTTGQTFSSLVILCVAVIVLFYRSGAAGADREFERWRSVPYFQNRLDFIASRTDIVATWNSYEAMVRVLKDINPTEDATITSR